MICPVCKGKDLTDNDDWIYCNECGANIPKKMQYTEIELKQYSKVE